MWNYIWTAPVYHRAVRRRHYAQEKAPLAAVEAPIHPLSSSTGSVAKIRKSVSSPLSIGDPLGFSLDGADPLSRFADADGTEPPQLQSIGKNTEKCFHGSFWFLRRTYQPVSSVTSFG